ncbi:alpha/beta hydrolase [Nocardia sp. NPDC051030]|uniref:alpha/beta hydrolase n=1 Tax=Nocardia sp. NPDC051030 TaxID=3155162 RepID=UPI0034362ED6
MPRTFIDAVRTVAAVAVPVLTAALCVTGCSKDSGSQDKDLQAFDAQTVHWGPCGQGDTAGWFTGEIPADQQCGQIVAPLDYSAARGKGLGDTPTVQLAVARRPATGQKTGSLLAISGGPGDPGLEMIEMSFPEAVRTDFDIVSYDPRGVGKSTPTIKCTSQGENAETGTDTDSAEQANRATVAACVAGTGVDVLRHIGSNEATDDVDLIRAVLGEQRINLLAASYGTQIAGMYAVRYPDGYRAAVLDGVVNIAESQNDMLIGQKRGYQSTFDRVIAYCTGEYRATEHTECPLGNDPATATTSFQQLLRDADAHPVPAGATNPVTGGEILTATTKGLLWKSSWVPYLNALQGVRHGDGTAIHELAETGSVTEESGTPAPRHRAGRDSSAQPSDPNAITAITCTDTADPTTDRAARQRDAQARYNASTYENYEPRPTEFPLDVCDLWPFPGAVHPSVPSRPDSAAPLLFVAQSHDPTTPLVNAQRMADYMRSPLLIREGDGHTFVFGDVDPCIDAEVVRYLRDPHSVQNKTCQ